MKTSKYDVNMLFLNVEKFHFNHFFSDLYEGLKIAQRGRLEDQRGTEINFEMPEFLKRGTGIVSRIDF